MTIQKNVINCIFRGYLNQKVLVFLTFFLTGVVILSSRHGQKIQLLQIGSTAIHENDLSKIVTTQSDLSTNNHGGKKLFSTRIETTPRVDKSTYTPHKVSSSKDPLTGSKPGDAHFINFQDIVNYNVNKISSGNFRGRYPLIDNTSNYRTSSFNHRPPSTEVPSPNNRARKPKTNQTMILLVTYLRSGSTFTADLIQQSSDIFYLYEPLKPYLRGQNYFTLNSVCHVINGTCRKQSGGRENIDNILDDVSKFYKCDLLNVPFSYFRFSNKSSTMLDYDRCRHYKTQYRCLKEFQERCKNSNRMIKTIRINMEIAEKLLEEFPQMKIIHLVRDPRGTYQSRKRGQFLRLQYNLEAITKSNCDILLSNLRTGFRLKEQYPDRVETILYEALAERPLEAARSLYRFLGLTEPFQFEQWVHNHTMAGYSNGYYDTVRQNSITTAYHWRRFINLKVVQSFDKNCHDVYKILGLNKFNSYTELHNTKLPVRHVSSHL